MITVKSENIGSQIDGNTTLPLNVSKISFPDFNDVRQINELHPKNYYQKEIIR